jgi:hypothetical protein
MINWLERARREIPESANRPTADSDERNLTAVTAVTDQASSENSGPSIGSIDSAPDAVLSEIEEAAIRTWLDLIDETDPVVISEVLNKCRTDKEALAYFLHRAEEVPNPLFFDDDRRHCTECANLTARGLCLAARRGEVMASRRTYHPVDHIPRRCEGYAPGPNDTDRRPGRERWPYLLPK